MRRMLISTLLLVLVATLVDASAGNAASAAKAKSAAASSQAKHEFYAPADIVWSDAPPSLPAGAKLAVLEGDASKAGLFTMRLRMPDGYKIPAHWHPATEHVTIISGTLHLGMGSEWDETKATALTAGSFGYMPKGMRHFAWSEGETEVQVHGMGPWGITYVNPADDPRKK
jgi:mannose-6-phosphate isomerase-like protein (cupin superfamily)